MSELEQPALIDEQDLENNLPQLLDSLVATA